MTRLIGAALLVGGCAGAGLRCRRAMREKVRVLADLIAALGRIRSELVTNRTPLGELTAQLAGNGPSAARDMFAFLAAGLKMPGDEGFSALWRCSLQRCPALDGEGTAALERLGAVLGRYSVGEQAAAIDRCTAELERQLRAAREKLQRDGALAPALATAAGLVGSVLLF